MKGLSFCFENIDFSSLTELINAFGITSLFKIISSIIPTPQTLEESLHFISQTYCEFFEEQYHHSLFIIRQNFHLLSFDKLTKITNSHLLKLFSSESFQIESEDRLVELVMKMIEDDKKRMILLQTIHFEFVSSNLLKRFFDNIHIDEVDFGVFESLKKRLFSDYSNQDKLSKRWKTKPKVLSESEAREIHDILNLYFSEENNPLFQIKSLIEQIKQLKTINDQQTEEIKQLQTELVCYKNPIMKGQTIQYKNNHNGLFQYLKKAKSNPFSFTCSSVLHNSSSYNPENILNYDSSYFWSQNEQNSWLCIQLTSQKVILSGYLLRSSTNQFNHNLKNWTLKASKDNMDWIQLDQQMNRNWVNPDWTEVYFPIQTKKSFSYFKFTQTGKNYNNSDYFFMNYLEFFGTILDWFSSRGSGFDSPHRSYIKIKKSFICVICFEKNLNSFLNFVFSLK
jgi:hypothetical protein